MDPRRAWDPRMDPRAGRGDGQQPLLRQQQQQAWEVPWQDQVRGNPQAEYAALAQARGSAEAGGAHPTGFAHSHSRRSDVALNKFLMQLFNSLRN